MQYIVIIIVVMAFFYYLCSTSELYENIGRPINYPYYNQYNSYIGPQIGGFPWYNSVTPLPFNNPTRFYRNNYLYPLIQDHVLARLVF
jgi:hypothetical protein